MMTSRLCGVLEPSLTWTPSAPKYTQGLAERSRNLDDSIEIRIYGNGARIPPKGRKQFTPIE